jgi:hypothetical protein
MSTGLTSVSSYHAFKYEVEGKERSLMIRGANEGSVIRLCQTWIYI